MEISDYDALPRTVSLKGNKGGEAEMAEAVQDSHLRGSSTVEFSWTSSARGRPRSPGAGRRDSAVPVRCSFFGAFVIPRGMALFGGSWVSSGRPGICGIRRNPCQLANEHVEPFCGPPCRSWAPSSSRLASLLPFPIFRVAQLQILASTVRTDLRTLSERPDLIGHSLV